MARPVSPIALRRYPEKAGPYKDPFDGDAHIASHVWDSDNYQMEIFGESAKGDDVQPTLQTFLYRDEARWNDKPSARKAKWSKSALIDNNQVDGLLSVEIVGDIGTNTIRPAWLHTLCKRLQSIDGCMGQADRQTPQHDFRSTSIWRIRPEKGRCFLYLLDHCHPLRTCRARQV